MQVLRTDFLTIASAAGTSSSWFLSDIELTWESTRLFRAINVLRLIEKQYLIANCAFSYAQMLLKVR